MKISIIVATFNSKRTISDTLDSILSQSYDDYEVLVQDCESSDGTLDIIHRYEPLFNGKLKLEIAKDFGIYDSFNKAIARASGDIIGILNSDDFYASDDILLTIAKAFDTRKEIDAIYADINYVSASDKNVIVRHFKGDEVNRKLMRAIILPPHPTFYAKRLCYEKYGNYDTQFTITADYDWSLRMLFVNKIKTLYIPKVLVYMRTGGFSDSGLKCKLKIINEHRRIYRKNGIYVFPLRYFLRYVTKLMEFKKGRLAV